jgi:hypothetical protein
MAEWSKGTLLEKRAAAAGLCEPGLLSEPAHVVSVLRILDDITRSLCTVEDRKREEFRVLRKALGYCWSVAVVALPAEGKAMIEPWFASDDRDVRWIVRENLRKKRLMRIEAEWVACWKARLGMSP